MIKSRKINFQFRLEHAVLENPPNILGTSDSFNSSSMTQYHVAAEQQDIENGDDEDDYDRISLNCEDGSLSSQSTNENLNRSKKLINEEQISNKNSNETITNSGVLDFSFPINDTNEHSNRSRSLNTSKKSRSLKRKHPNGNIDHGGTISMPTRIFHADAFCGICRKEFCNKYFLKTQ